MDTINYETAAFEIISFAGAARALFSEAIDLIIEKELEQAQEKIELGKKELAKVHSAHFNLISHEAKGNKLEFSLLLTHAEDQFMTAENTLFLAEKWLLKAKQCTH